MHDRGRPVTLKGLWQAELKENHWANWVVRVRPGELLTTKGLGKTTAPRLAGTDSHHPVLIMPVKQCGVKFYLPAASR